MPGGGSSYSFRVGDYVINRLADINFRKGKFEALAVLTHGIIVSLGDVPIESLDLKSDGIKHLLKISPSQGFFRSRYFCQQIDERL